MLRRGHFVEFGKNRSVVEGAKSESGASRLESGDDLGDVVADETESGGLGVLLDDSPERKLGSIGHTVALVENDELDSL